MVKAAKGFKGDKSEFLLTENFLKLNISKNCRLDEI